jgi:acyl-CoA thioesterase-2
VTESSPLLRVLELQRLDGDLFMAPAGRADHERLFGGQVAAQALRAASLTVERSRPVHSLHCYFIRGGRFGEPLHLEVTRLRDGRAFSTRSVTVAQQGKPILEMIASFQDREDGENWQPVEPVHPRPEGLPQARPLRLFTGYSPVEIRHIKEPPDDPDAFAFRHPFWVRVNAEIGPDPNLHACLLTYLSDLGPVDSARSPSAVGRHSVRLSLDHSIWFHRATRMDQWHIYDMGPLAHISTRGLAQGTLKMADGALVASVTQEALLRR